MPNSFVNGVAQSQVQAPNQYADARQAKTNPWDSYVYDEVATNKGRMGVGPTGQLKPQAGDKFGEREANVWFDNGSNGAGYYRLASADTPDSVLAQGYYANQFRQNADQTKNTLYNQFASSQNANMNAGLKNVRQGNSNRGLLYGGINAGNEQGVRAKTSGLLAQGRSDINAGVESAANGMVGNAIDTGFAIQQQQQQIQNDIYAQAMAKASGVGAVAGNVLGAIGGVVAGYYTGGAGAAAGYTAGNSLGKSL